MKEGGVKKTKKRPTTKTQTKPPVLIKHRVDSNPAKAEKAPDLMREGAAEEQISLSAVLLPSHPTGIPTSTLWEQKKNHQMLCKAGILFDSCLLIVFQTSQGWGFQVWVPGDGMVPAQQGWRRIFKYGLS